ncbi:MAG TPA: Crp/Fnr family transcriptional regulator [Planctomycetota bacterium]|nr:Crp/Fnr family transcriptional regulator [Planctomycetota bacterium]
MKTTSDHVENVALLRRVAFLQGISDTTLSTLATRAVRRRFARGEPICREGQSCAGVWIVVQGAIQGIKISGKGRLQVLETASAAGTCSLASSLDGGSCPMRTEAQRDSTLLLVPQAALLEAVAADPALGLALARHLGERLRGLACQVVSLGLRDVRTRVAAFLLDEAARRGVRAPDGSTRLQLPCSQGELARRLGTGREVVARALRSLRQEGLIEQARSRVSIPDLARLRALTDSA